MNYHVREGLYSLARAAYAKARENNRKLLKDDSVSEFDYWLRVSKIDAAFDKRAEHVFGHSLTH